MKKPAFFLLVCIVLMATGCPKKLYQTRPSTKLAQNELNNTINDYLKNRQIAYYCALDNRIVVYNNLTNKYDCRSGANTDATVGPAMARRMRDETIELGITAVDSVYNDFIDDMNTGRATVNFIADVIDLGVGTAIGISKGERPLQILGVALNAFRGGRKSIDVNFFREQTIPILVNKMDDNRAKVYSEILQKKAINKDKPVTDYSMGEVVRDIVNYFNAGTLIRAFAELSKDTAAKAKSNEDKIIQLKGLKNLDAITPQEIIQPSIDIDDELTKLGQQITDPSEKVKKTAAARLELILTFIKNDKVFEETINKLDAEGTAEDKAIVKKVKDKTTLTPKETYEFIRGIYEFTTNDVPRTQKLLQIIQKAKVE